MAEEKFDFEKFKLRTRVDTSQKLSDSERRIYNSALTTLKNNWKEEQTDIFTDENKRRFMNTSDVKIASDYSERKKQLEDDLEHIFKEELKIYLRYDVFFYEIRYYESWKESFDKWSEEVSEWASPGCHVNESINSMFENWQRLVINEENIIKKRAEKLHNDEKILMLWKNDKKTELKSIISKMQK